MEQAQAEVDIERGAEDVWGVVGDFGDLSWSPGLGSVTVDGDVRTIEMGGIEIKERLVSHDDAGRAISYSIIEGPMPIEHHQATITVTPTGEGSCHVTWDVETEPEGAAFLADIYQSGLGALKSQLEA